MRLLTLTSIIMLAATGAFAQETPSPEGAKVYFANVADGDTIAQGTTIVFGLSGMGIAPAGIEQENTGHHHLFKNRPPFGEGEFGAEELEIAIPADENHQHFGGGQTEVVLDLPPGEHTLQLVLGDASHVPHNPPVVSEVITITVE